MCEFHSLIVYFSFLCYLLYYSGERMGRDSHHRRKRKAGKDDDSSDENRQSRSPERK